MSQPVFSTGLEEDLVQRVGTKLHLEVTVEDQSEKVPKLIDSYYFYYLKQIHQVFFEWRGPSGSNADDGRIVITETGNTSTAEITPLHLQVRNNTSEFMDIIPFCYRTKASGPAQLRISMGSTRQRLMFLLKV